MQYTVLSAAGKSLPARPTGRPATSELGLQTVRKYNWASLRGASEEGAQLKVQGTPPNPGHLAQPEQRVPGGLPLPAAGQRGFETGRTSHTEGRGEGRGLKRFKPHVGDVR